MPKTNIYTHCQRAECGKEKQIPETNYVPAKTYAEDPYCSRPCSEIDQGTKTEQELADESSGKNGRSRTGSGASAHDAVAA